MLNEDGNSFIEYPGPERLLNSSRLAQNLGGRPTNFSAQAHHIIPDAVMRYNPLLRRAYDNQPQLFDFDSSQNGVFLSDNPGEMALAQALNGGRDLPYHSGSHTQYNNAVAAFADTVLNNLTQNTPLANLTDAQIQTAVLAIKNEADRMMLDPNFRDAAGRLK